MEHFLANFKESKLVEEYLKSFKTNIVKNKTINKAEILDPAQISMNFLIKNTKIAIVPLLIVQSADKECMSISPQIILCVLLNNILIDIAKSVLDKRNRNCVVVPDVVSWATAYQT